MQKSRSKIMTVMVHQHSTFPRPPPPPRAQNTWFAVTDCDRWRHERLASTFDFGNELAVPTSYTPWQAALSRAMVRSAEMVLRIAHASRVGSPDLHSKRWSGRRLRLGPPGCGTVNHHRNARGFHPGSEEAGQTAPTGRLRSDDVGKGRLGMWSHRRPHLRRRWLYRAALPPPVTSRP